MCHVRAVVNTYTLCRLCDKRIKRFQSNTYNIVLTSSICQERKIYCRLVRTPRPIVKKVCSPLERFVCQWEFKWVTPRGDLCIWDRAREHNFLLLLANWVSSALEQWALVHPAPSKNVTALRFNTSLCVDIIVLCIACVWRCDVHVCDCAGDQWFKSAAVSFSLTSRCASVLLHSPSKTNTPTHTGF